MQEKFTFVVADMKLNLLLLNVNYIPYDVNIPDSTNKCDSIDSIGTQV